MTNGQSESSQSATVVTNYQHDLCLKTSKPIGVVIFDDVWIQSVGFMEWIKYGDSLFGISAEPSHVAYIKQHITPHIDEYARWIKSTPVSERDDKWRLLVSHLDHETAQNPLPTGLLITLSRDDDAIRTSELSWPKFILRGLAGTLAEIVRAAADILQ